MAVLRLITSSILRRRLHRQVGRLLALEDAIDIAGRAPMQVDRIGPVGDKTSICDETALKVDRWQLVPVCERNDQIAISQREGARREDHTAVRRAARTP